MYSTFTPRAPPHFKRPVSLAIAVAVGKIVLHRALSTVNVQYIFSYLNREALDTSVLNAPLWTELCERRFFFQMFDFKYIRECMNNTIVNYCVNIAIALFSTGFYSQYSEAQR